MPRVIQAGRNTLFSFYLVGYVQAASRDRRKISPLAVGRLSRKYKMTLLSTLVCTCIFVYIYMCMCTYVFEASVRFVRAPGEKREMTAAGAITWTLRRGCISPRPRKIVEIPNRTKNYARQTIQLRHYRCFVREYSGRKRSYRDHVTETVCPTIVLLENVKV